MSPPKGYLPGFIWGLLWEGSRRLALKVAERNSLSGSRYEGSQAVARGITCLFEGRCASLGPV
jgi:hypothetical protein